MALSDDVRRDEEVSMKFFQMEVIILLMPALTFAVGKQESFITLSAFFRPQFELNDP